MHTNGANGGHRYEPCEKRVNPATFPCRLDMEFCACGAKRWEDQQGRPAPPWQFLILRQKGKSEELEAREAQVNGKRSTPSPSLSSASL